MRGRKQPVNEGDVLRQYLRLGASELAQIEIRANEDVRGVGYGYIVPGLRRAAPDDAVELAAHHGIETRLKVLVGGGQIAPGVGRYAKRQQPAGKKILFRHVAAETADDLPSRGAEGRGAVVASLPYLQQSRKRGIFNGAISEHGSHSFRDGPYFCLTSITFVNSGRLCLRA